ncbi:ATP-grasp domain-containing protein [Acidithrix sp. C25]|uniref:ATP-grasp domain-containing protein n=1 Tax=Acidithrix sp. C25 TaxID=1671482 RepID=UPI001BB86200|nr:ATP-grasp domain-containing protein [Acidithrix sp. C25]CAG4931311.1 unnamed protein product [Acidithrix sp. C25]
MIIMPANTYRAQRFITAAIELGVEVTVATDSDFSPPDPTKNVIDGISFCDPKSAGRALGEIAIEKGIKKAIAIDEGGVEVAAWTQATISNLSSPPIGTLVSRDKANLRKTLTAAGVPQPTMHQVIKGEQLEQFSENDFPLIVKPSKGSGSIGVVRADNLKELKEALEITDLVISEMALNDQVTLIESYIGGTEFAVELLVVEGKVHVLAIFEKPDPLEGPYFEETIYITPPRISKSDYEVIVASMDLCIKALEISNGPMHIEVRVRPDGVVFPIDIATRSIGGNCSDVLNFDGMVSLETLIISNALNLEMPNISREKQASGVYMIPVDDRGYLREISGLHDAERVGFIESISITAAIGNHYRPVPYDNKYLGFIFAKAPTSALVEAALRKARKRLNIVYSPSKSELV